VVLDLDTIEMRLRAELNEGLNEGRMRAVFRSKREGNHAKDFAIALS
jgi:hypothetical protein